ncbi:MAG: ABC transporter permease [Gammaproteobacteria bacterium]|nr:ABC transporter permease [Gammaproteobacteria bacterium]MBV8404079.1 ABC transporter permease [Gammaproteobacteria bacterium]
MLGYYLRLALMSFRRRPGISALMVLAIALGIAVCVMTLTVYHAMSGNPIWWKSERLYAVTMDNWDPNQALNPKTNLPPPEMTYKDAQFLYRSDIPLRKVVMYSTEGVVTGAGSQPAAEIATRVTTADFFPMFEVPFLYGAGWSRSGDSPAQPLIVLSRRENERLFAGANSVGRTLRWNDHEFRVVGVLDDWFPRPRYYDLNGGNFQEPDDAYIPYGWGAALQLQNKEENDCWRPEKLDNFQDYLASDCVWQQVWVELPDRATRERFQSFMDGYWAEQRSGGRFPRAKNNRLSDVAQWLRDNEVVDNDNRVLVGLAFAFLALCLINTMGLLLARFLNGAALSGIRRALGASRRQIFAQLLTEAGVLAVLGTVLGLALAALGLAAVHHLYAAAHLGQRGGYQELTHFDVTAVTWAVVLAVAATLGAGLYPAWRIGRLSPALYLKSQ